MKLLAILLWFLILPTSAVADAWSPNVPIGIGQITNNTNITIPVVYIPIGQQVFNQPFQPQPDNTQSYIIMGAIVILLIIIFLVWRQLNWA